MIFLMLKMSFFTLKRILKDIVSLGILFITPMVLITILGMIADGAVNENLGIPQVDAIALNMILAFQLFAGFYTMELMKQDLLEKRKWRMMSLPIPIYRYMQSILLVTIFYGGLQSYLLTHFTRIFYDVNWGNQLQLIFAIFLISIVMQSIYLNIALSFKKYKTMERTALGIAFTSMFFGGVWFQLPDQAILNFLGTYGNPYSLAENVLLDGMRGQFSIEGILSIVFLGSLSLVLIILSSYLGRRAYR